MTPRCVALLLSFATLFWGAPATPVALPTLNVRLTTPLTSYDSVAGSQFESVVIAPYIVDGRVLLPQGTVVFGTVRQTKEVGLGFVRERASIRLEFQEYALEDGRRFLITGVLRQIENARETVTESGQIRGILAANNPQSLIQGVWHRPSLGHFPRSFVGLTGAGGKIFTEYSMGPIGAIGLFAARLVMFRLPEPEIQLPAGTEMKVTIRQMAPDSPSFVPLEPEPLATELAEFLATQPIDVTKPGGEQAEDIINLAFEGSKEELDAAFRSAGWFEADALTTRTFARAYRSYTRQTGYPEAPVSKLLYQGADPDAVYQKSFNTISKRHHIRLWRIERDGRGLWLGAATHDIGVRFKKRAMTFTHKIDPRIDLERSKIVNDLVFTGCAEDARYVDRPNATRSGDADQSIVTDGRLAAMSLLPCQAPDVDAEPEAPQPPQSRLGRLARRLLLEGRQYVLRGNAYYWVYRAVTFRRSSSSNEERELVDD